MLRTTVALWHVISSHSISDSVTGLNKMLDVKSGETPPHPDTLKAYLSKSVIPILEGTSLDQRHNTTAMRRTLGKLVRDASFAAVTLNANPQGRFVRTIVDCVKQDHERMRFMQRMSSMQAGKIIECLLTVGVRDEAVYAILISKLDYCSLKEIGRACFAFTEFECYELVTNAVVPLYNNESWELTYEDHYHVNKEGAQAGVGSAVAAPNVFEAVRVIRALSKSTRAVVEKSRKGSQRRVDASTSAAVIPYESINVLRNNLLEFIFKHQETIRGAHWINLARALIHFPAEVQPLTGLQGNSIISKELHSLVGAPHTVDPARPTCNDVALLCLQKLFASAHMVAKKESEDEKMDVPPGLLFFEKLDITPNDAIKLREIIRQVPCDPAIAEERLCMVLDATAESLPSMHFGYIVQLLRVQRRLNTSAEEGETVTKKASALVKAAVAEAGACLVRQPPQATLASIPFGVITQFASHIATFHSKSCRGFVEFMEKASAHFPSTLHPDIVVTYVSALTTAVSISTPAVRAAVGELVSRFITYTTANVSDVSGGDVFATWPLQCIKLYRGMVLLEVPPKPSDLALILGDGERPRRHLSMQLQQVGASVIFDFSRSLAHFCRHARTEQPDLVPQLWSIGIRSTALPLLVAYTRALEATVTQRSQRIASYEPIAWRSTMETVTTFVDPQLDTADFERMATMLLEVADDCLELARLACSIAEAENRVLRARGQSGKSDLHVQFGNLLFSSNAVVHMLSYILMFENLIMQGSRHARNLRLNKSDNSSSSSALELGSKLEALQERYESFLSTPLKTGVTDTPLSVIYAIFGAEDGITADDAPLLRRSDILEITTQLPFAISLVMDPGRVNEVFSEKCVPIMLGGVA